MATPLERLRMCLQRRKIAAALITQPENRRYLSGYTAPDHGINETSGVLLIPATGEPFLFTDSRYQLQAEKDAPGFSIEIYKRGLFNLLRKKLPSLGIQSLVFESHYLLHSSYLALEKLAGRKKIELHPMTSLVEDMRIVKSSEELAKIKAAVELNEKVFRIAHNSLRPGQTEKEVAIRIENLMRELGAEGPAFETIVASGPNGALPHAVPSERKLLKGEPIIIDMGLRLNGYCSDMSRTVVLGTPDNKTVALIRLVRKAQLAGIKALRAGVSGLSVDRVAREVISRAGMGEHFGHGLGHGVGLAVHEAPALNWRNRKHLHAGMVVTVEPGVYLPGWGGIRLENMAVVGEDGCEMFNRDETFLDI